MFIPYERSFTPRSARCASICGYLVYGGCNALDTVSAVLILMKDTNALETPSVAVKGYCVKCRAKRELEDLEEVETKQKLGVRGKCVECGCKIMRFTGSKTRNRPKGYRVEMARLRRAEARRQKLIDALPPVVLLCEDEPEGI